jgi:hypothetical protein
VEPGIALVGAIFIARVTGPEPAKPFAWLNRPQQTNVFVPVLLGAGIALSGLAWLVDQGAPATARRLARRTTAPALRAAAVVG